MIILNVVRNQKTEHEQANAVNSFAGMGMFEVFDARASHTPSHCCCIIRNKFAGTDSATI